jgi:hypothetical protein
MSNKKTKNTPHERDWLDIGLKAMVPVVGGLLIAFAGYVSEITLSSLAQKQQSARLITELQISREQAESSLRKDVFDQALQAFLLKGQGQVNSLNGMSKQLLRLELLSLNFGDSLSLSPLFIEFSKDLNKLEENEQNKTHNLHKEKGLLDKRLKSLAKRVASSQISSLVQHGTSKSFTIPLMSYDPDTFECGILQFDKETYSVPEREIQEQFVIYKDENNNLIDDEKLDDIFSEITILQQTKKAILALLTDSNDQAEPLEQTERTKQIENRKTDLSRMLETVADLTAKLQQDPEQDPEQKKEELERLNGIKKDILQFQRAIKDIDSTGVAAQIKALEQTINNQRTEIFEAYRESLNEARKIELQGIRRNLEIVISDVDHCKKSVKVSVTIYCEANYVDIDNNSGDMRSLNTANSQCLTIKNKKNKKNKNIETDNSIQDDTIRDRGALAVKSNQGFEVEITRSFHLDYFNFPMVDNTRLQNNHRFAIVLEDFDATGDDPRIEIIGLMFPSEYASLRDRPGMSEAKTLLENALDDE